MKRVPAGIDGLDPLIEEGIPKQSLVLVSGAPGTGKTSLCCKFLERGASVFGEKGLYVSLFESKEVMVENLSHQFGPEFPELVRRGMIEILSFPTMKGKGLSVMMDVILSAIDENKARRLVIDSLSSLLEFLPEEQESRMFIHNILTKIIPSYECTTLVTKETPSDGVIGASAEDFVADGLFLLRRLIFQGRTLRELEVAKLRGTKISSPTIPFTLEGGFTVFPPFHHRTFEWAKKLRRIPDSENHFSTGIDSLDRILAGGYSKGSIALLEADEAIPLTAYGVMSYPIVANFLNNGSPLVGIQSLGADPARTYERWKAFAGENASRARSVEQVKGTVQNKKPYLTLLRSEKPEGRLEEYLRAGAKLRKQTGKPVLWWVALDHFADIFGLDYAEKALSQLSVEIIRHKELAVLLAKPGLESIMKTVSNIAATHLHIMDRHGTILLHGIKPRTPLYGIRVEIEKGLNSTVFTSIV